MEELELLSFKIISAVGMAKSSYIEAMKAAEIGDFELVNKKIKEGKKFFNKGHVQHSKVLQMEANKQLPILSVLLIHAEDQLMSVETIYTLLLQLVSMQRRLHALESKD